MAVSLHHVNIRAGDLEATIAFHVDAIGPTEGWRPPFGFAGAWLYSTKARGRWSICPSPVPAPRAQGPGPGPESIPSPSPATTSMRR